MTATSGKFFGAGARRGRWYKLDSNGYPDAQSHSTPYEGIEILGITGLDTTIPDARRIPIPGDDRVQATITLPRTEPSSATVRMSGQYYDLVAALSNTKKFTDGEAVGIAYGTDKQGSEADGVLLVNQFGKDAVSKLTRWRCQLFLLVNAVINPPSMADGQANQISMQVTPSATAYMPWREALRIASRLVETNLAFDNRRRITELENATLRLKASRLARDLRRDIVKLRHDAFEAVRQRSRLGLAAREELASAEEALLAARLDLLRDRAEILNAYHAFMSGILLDPVDQLYTAPSNER